MMTPMRYILLVLGVIISIHYIMSFTYEEYGKATSISNFAEQWTAPKSNPLYKTPVPDEYCKPDSPMHLQDRKANASIVVLVRNSELWGIMSSMKQLEDRFNRKFQYPYVFLNDEPFTQSFQDHIRALTNATVEFGLIPPHHWHQPSWIDEERASKSRDDMIKNDVIYGGRYRNMCRFNSGFFYRHELLQKYRYYWRVEPDIQLFCDVDYDPFLMMQDQNKVYGFTIAISEIPATIPTLWDVVKSFIDANPDTVVPGNAMEFLSDDDGKSYSLCHFWSNFEIADLDFWRGEAYSKFFEYLDEQGGFYYERWGDAPVHSIGAALFAKKEQIHFFNDIGYQHEPFEHCPQGDVHTKGKCWCNPDESVDYQIYSCLNRYDKLFS
ncbi:glycosyltransferase family 15 protein [Suillus plorans]|uniref:Glycosyltransferase family 15 protein n=1 Tax=Suillus plorans TaxID=116603 RepID=A0A9P7E3V1_9AGAM|nr:glycosyltransferase family 15 protein [Suillus plorans]KAG1810434.1 glycosyltransferase family 15 protein [Suillus plorans]